MPPSSFVSSVYCASPGASRSTSFERSALQEVPSRRALDLDLAHVRDVEDAGVAADGPVLGDHALVLHGHLPARERDHARAERDVAIVERRPAERLHPAAMLTPPGGGNSAEPGLRPVLRRLGGVRRGQARSRARSRRNLLISRRNDGTSSECRDVELRLRGP